MLRNYCFFIILAVCAGATTAQTKPSLSAAPGPNVQTRDSAPFNLAEYGVSFQPDARLIIVMAALDAAGFDPTPSGKEPSAFRALVRKDQANLDAGLSERLKAYFERSKLPAPATAADQAARYVSLAYALGPPGFWKCSTLRRWCASSTKSPALTSVWSLICALIRPKAIACDHRRQRWCGRCCLTCTRDRFWCP